MKPARRKLFFRLMLLLVVAAGLETAGYVGMWVNSRSFDFLSNKNYFQIRAMLRGVKDPEHLPRYLTLPYLGYIPYPGYRKFGIEQHNEDGYRGKRVPLRKNENLRILCLGGSATYGYAVDSPSQTFPARLEDLLCQYITSDSNLSRKYKGAEVINAGLEAGNSAEELQQYLFKYRYYKPDVVIIHSGVNDAMLAANSTNNFQLDYTNSKRLYFNLEPLSYPGRWFLKSYFISFITIRLFYDNFVYNGESGRDCFSRQPNQQFCSWSHINIDSIVNNKQYGYYPFYRNTQSLYEAIKSDSAVLLVFPNALNTTSEFVISNKKYADFNSLNASLSQYLCNQYNGLYVPFSFDSIRQHSSWVDDCHVNADGEKNKAEILCRQLVNYLNQHNK